MENMDDSHNIKILGNQQLGLHYEVIHQKFDDIKLEIIDDITDLLGEVPTIDFETYNDPQKFHAYCKGYQSYIQETNKEMFLHLLKQENNIQKEIGRRQLQMLQEIGIIAPSVRVKIIMNQTKGENFPVFDDMIRYIKLARQGKVNRRPKNRKIYISQNLTEIFDKLRTTIFTALANNTGPIAN